MCRHGKVYLYGLCVFPTSPHIYAHGSIHGNLSYPLSLTNTYREVTQEYCPWFGLELDSDRFVVRQPCNPLGIVDGSEWAHTSRSIADNPQSVVSQDQK